MTTSTAVQAAWCIYDGFEFLAHVEAADEEEARQKADSLLGLNKRLQVFLDGSDTVTTFAARNTFSLFQQYGGLTIDWTETNYRVGPIARESLRSLIDCMTKWVDTPGAAQMADMVGSDLRYVRDRINDFNQLLNGPRWAYTSWFKIELGSDNNRQDERDYERADAYSDFLYTSSPED